MATETEAPAVADARPRVGLVLSGGGARGGAHIGVLRALEELRVPIDYIAGTSIGAIIGGLYASGMSVEELEALVRGIDWQAAFLNTTPRRLRSFRRKRDDDLFLVDQKPGLNDGEFELPIGLVQGQVIDMILARNALPAAQIEDFDDLPIPFRAVATDIATGEAVVLGSGDLARAMRASMSLPAIISPVEVDGRLLVDGGVAMNLPVEVVQDMGADVVIAVDLTTELTARDQIRSIFDVTLQLTNFLTRETLDAQLAQLGEDDVLLTAEFEEDLNLAAFSRMAGAIPQGYELAMGEREAIGAFSLGPEAYAAGRAARPDPREAPLPVVDFIRIENESILADRVIEARLAGIEIGEQLDVGAVETAINRVYGLELYQNVRYDVVDQEGQTGLEIDLQERAWGPNYLQLGLKYSSAGDGNALFGLAASYLRTGLNELGGEWRATLIVGDEPALLADLYQPFGPAARYFFAPALNFESRLAYVRMDDRIVTEAELREAALELAAGRELASWGELRLGLRIADGGTRLRIGDPALLPSGDYRRGEFFARLSADTLDNVSFPRRGVLAFAEWRGSRPGPLSADARFDQLSIDGAYAHSWGRHTMLATFRYDATVSGEAPVPSLFRMGGLFDLSGLNRNELAGQHAARLGASYYRRVGDLALFPAFAGLTLEVGNVWDERSDIGAGDAIVGGALWAGVQTPIGPVYVGWGTTEGGDQAAYVFLGRIL